MRVAAAGDDYTVQPEAIWTGKPVDFQAHGVRVQMQRVGGLTHEGVLAQPFVFQVPPLEEFARTLGYTWTDYDTVNQGQFSRPQGRQLTTISFNTLFTLDDASYTLYDPMDTRGWDPLDMVGELEDILRTGTPFKLVVGEPAIWATAGDASRAEIRMLATLRSLTVAERAGEPDARYTNVAFTEYRVPQATERMQGRGTANSRTLPPFIPLRAFRPADHPHSLPRPPANVSTLYALATWAYGSAARWKDISAANAWMKGIEPSHDLGNWNTAQLKQAAAADRKIQLPKGSH